MKTLMDMPQYVTIHVTAQRVMLVLPDVDPGSGAMTELADVFLFGAVGTTLAEGVLHVGE